VKSWGLGRSAVKSWGLGILGGGALVASALGVNELAVLFAAGVLASAARQGRWIAVAPIAGPGSAAAAAVPFSLLGLFLFFAKVGAILFGSGYVLLAFLRADLVDRWGWLTEAQLLDAVAVGQITPGPVFSAATFIGYVLGSAPGAVVATVGIFLLAFVFVALSGPLVPRVRRSPAAGAFLGG
jgi:chromate transporter